MKKIAIMLVLLWPAAAGAVPTTINFTGRLTTSTGPVTGAINLTLKLYDVATGGTPLWSEIHGNVGADSGLVFVDAGSLTTLDETIFDGRRLFMEVTVGTETLAPRLAINSVPYALRTTVATNAELLGTSIGPGDVVTSVNAGPGIAAAKTGNAVSVSLSTTGCVNGQVYKFNGTTFACANDLNTTYTGGAGISVSGTTVSLATTGCATGSVWKFNGTTFACAPDADTIYTGGTGISVSGTSIAINTAVVPQLNTANTFTGGNNFSGANTFSNASNSFTGSGAGLTNLNANNLTTGTVSSSLISGSYTGITAVGTLGGGLTLNGEVQRPSTGAANLVPIAYGNVSGNGAVNTTGSTPNVTVTRTGVGSYNIAIAGESYFFTDYVTNVTVNTLSACAVAGVNSVGGHLLINITLCNGTLADEAFMFVTYKP